jgi:poly(3-hydroxybutyrate) depolymerase
MAYRMLGDHADRLAAIATWSGTTFLDPDRCHPAEPVNVLHVHATGEDGFPYWGGTLNTTVFGLPANMPPFPGAERNVQTWAGYNGAENAVTELSPSLDLTPDVPGLDTVITRYTSHPPGGEVELWTILGGSHLMNRSPEFMPRIIDWLLAHPKP